MEDDPARRLSIGIVLNYAQYLVPSSDIGAMARGQGANLVRLLNWAQNPYIKRVNVAVCLIAEKLSEVNDRLVQNPHVAAIDVPLPDRAGREAFTNAVGPNDELKTLTEFTRQSWRS